MSDKQETIKAINAEEALLQELRFSGLEKSRLKELVTIVADVQRRGARGIKVFPKGIPNPDGVWCVFVLPKDNIATLGDLLAKTPMLASSYVFPIGIPWPDFFKVVAEIGPSVKNIPTQEFAF